MATNPYFLAVQQAWEEWQEWEKEHDKEPAGPDAGDKGHLRAQTRTCT
jgi:hypothetical protein